LPAGINKHSEARLSEASPAYSQKKKSLACIATL
jgi:hypothetical protein